MKSNMRKKNSHGKILVVDDELKMCQSLKTLLSQDGYQVSTIQDGKKAIQMLKGKDFDLVMTVIKMPSIPKTSRTSNK